MTEISQKEFIYQYYEKNPGRPIAHAEVVDYVVPEYRITTGKILRDPDRAIRSLHSEGKLVKVSTGVYKFDPDVISKPDPQGFTATQRGDIMRRGNFMCARCGATAAEGVSLHADHIRPRSRGGESTVENGQVLCGRHNYMKKHYGQTETGKRMFIDLRRLAEKEGDQVLVAFVDDVLQIYEEHGINSHVAWQKPMV